MKAQFSLGTMYVEGRGVPQDYAEAMRWYRKVAEQGHASAQYNLAFLYGHGEGVPRNHVEAFKWFSLSARNGNQFARKALKELAEKMTPAQIEEAKRLSREWKPKAGDSQTE